jgi:ribulose-phosphate 3-epimerase
MTRVMSRCACLDSLRRAAPAILPSLLLCDFGNLEREVARLRAAGLAALHLDVMDGQFVPNLTYGMPIVHALRQLTDLTLDVHLMIADPRRFLRQFVDAGADIVTIHVEAVSQPAAVLREIRALGVGAGIALNPDTPLSALDGCYEHCDLVLVMSVPAGFGGQSFRADALDKLRALRAIVGPEVLLEVDGGINQATISGCAAAGAQLFVVGSAIFRAASYEQAVRELQSLART